MKILVYGGTFNPVHLAHIENINLVCQDYDFDKILIVPNKRGHFKEKNELAPIADRLTMLELALKKLNKGISVEISMVEVESEKDLYTYDVIDILSKEYKQVTFYFLIGSDQANLLGKWYKIEELKQKVKFIITKRTTECIENSEFIVINNDVMPYSSTAIREAYATSGIRDVDDYIRKYGLYLDIVVKKYLNEKRFIHSKNTAKLAKETAKKYGIDENKAYVAGMLHDIAKEIPLIEQYELIRYDGKLFECNDDTIHAYSADYVVRNELLINDKEILSAIRKHTTADYEMSGLDKLIYVCDMLEPTRDFAGIDELRKLLNVDLNECFKACFIRGYKHLIDKNVIISEELEKLKDMIERNEV